MFLFLQFRNGQATLTGEDWLTREYTDKATRESMRLGPRAAENPSLTFWIGTSLDTAGMVEVPVLQDQVPIVVPILPPYEQFLDLQSYFNSASPTDFRKDISAMRGDRSGFGIQYPGRPGHWSICSAKTDQQVKTVTIYRKMLKNELVARLVLGAGGAPTGAPGNGADVVNVAGARYWLDRVANPMQQPFVAGQDYPCGGGRPLGDADFI